MDTHNAHTWRSRIQPIALGDPHLLRINEWLAAPNVSVNNDFIELYNPDPAPVALGGLHLTDHPTSWPDRHAIPPLSFVDGQGLAVLIADSDPRRRPGSSEFRIVRDAGSRSGSFDATSQRIDQVLFGPQRDDVSQGLAPNGGVTIVDFITAKSGSRQSVHRQRTGFAGSRSRIRFATSNPGPTLAPLGAIPSSTIPPGPRDPACCTSKTNHCRHPRAHN